MATVKILDSAKHPFLENGLISEEDVTILPHFEGNAEYPRIMPEFTVQKPGPGGTHTPAFQLDLSRVPHSVRTEAWEYVNHWFPHLPADQRALKALELMAQNQQDTPVDVAVVAATPQPPPGPPPAFMPTGKPTASPQVNPHFARTMKAAFPESHLAGMTAADRPAPAKMGGAPPSAVPQPPGPGPAWAAASPFSPPFAVATPPPVPGPAMPAVSRAREAVDAPPPSVRVDFYIDNVPAPFTCYYHGVERRPGWLFLATDTRYPGTSRLQVDMLEQALTVVVGGHSVAYRCLPAACMPTAGTYEISGLVVEGELPLGG